MDDELENQSVNIRFQWMVGDTHPLEKFIKELAKNKHHYVITVSSRFVAFVLVFLTTNLLLPSIELWKIFTIAIVGSYSLWVSWGLGVIAVRQLERIMASDPENIGLNDIKIDRSGIRWDDAISSIYVSWQGIEEIEEKDGAIWLKTGKAHGFWIPERVFESDSQRAEILSLIKRFRNSPILPTHMDDWEQSSTKLQ